ncbi:hypothetical protein, partial [Escherichia coli]|uniref:hypothetical protein n=1 Tax=Escherichia coli TaxID=562 RepID=UPI001125AF70
ESNSAGTIIQATSCRTFEHQFGMGIILTGASGGRPCGARSPLPVGCSPRPVTGQADRGIPQPSSF